MSHKMGSDIHAKSNKAIGIGPHIKLAPLYLSLLHQEVGDEICSAMLLIQFKLKSGLAAAAAAAGSGWATNSEAEELAAPTTMNLAEIGLAPAKTSRIICLGDCPERPILEELADRIAGKSGGLEEIVHQTPRAVLVGRLQRTARWHYGRISIMTARETKVSLPAGGIFMFIPANSPRAIIIQSGQPLNLLRNLVEKLSYASRYFSKLNRTSWQLILSPATAAA